MIITLDTNCSTGANGVQKNADQSRPQLFAKVPGDLISRYSSIQGLLKLSLNQRFGLVLITKIILRIIIERLEDQPLERQHIVYI